MSSRKKLYPIAINPTLPEELKGYINKCAQDSGRTENDIMRQWIDELMDYNISDKELKRFCY